MHAVQSRNNRTKNNGISRVEYLLLYVDFTQETDIQYYSDKLSMMFFESSLAL